MNFGEALEVLKNGGRVRRKGWNEGDWLQLKLSKEMSISKEPLFLAFRDSIDGWWFWSPYHADLLAEDWKVVAD